MFLLFIGAGPSEKNLALIRLANKLMLKGGRCVIGKSDLF